MTINTWHKILEPNLSNGKIIYRVAQKMYTLVTHQYLWNKL